MSGSGAILRKGLLSRASPLVLAAAFGAAAQPAAAQPALPTNGAVSSGAASIQSGGAKSLSINQTSQRAVIDWNSFSIGGGGTVNFNQPGATAATLNRVNGSTPSTIAGQLNANGQVYLVNPNGIAITRNGAVNVGGGFVASTLGITNENFNSGQLNFSGGGASATVKNAGAITTASGGFVGLLGGSVSNSGVITAPLGKVGLGSGERATLDLTGDKFLQVAMPTDATTTDGKGLVDVSGKVSAAGGTVELKAATAAKAIYNAVNVPGELNASSAVARGGSIVLGGGPGGSVRVSGKLAANGATRGGTIVVSGHDAKLKGAKVLARAGVGVGGAVDIVAARAIKLATTKVDVSGPTGGGAIRIGGDFHGASDLPAAQTVKIDGATSVLADATIAGDGGTVAIWSNRYTSFAGAASARGGPQGGNGGSVEVSAHAATEGVLAYTGSVDLRAPAGLVGTLLLDPYDIVISSGADSGGSFSSGTYTPTTTSVINNATLEAQLATSNVIVSTGGAGSPGTDAGNIAVNAPIAWSSVFSLTLTAANAIAINAPISAPAPQSGGTPALNLNAAIDGATVPGAQLLKLSFGEGGSVTFASPSFTGPTRLTINGQAYSLIGSMADLASINLSGANLSGNYALANNLTGGSHPDSVVAPDAGTPGSGAPFTGVFEGLGHKIDSLTIVGSSPSAASSYGLFGVVSGTVRNLNLTNVSVSSSTPAANVGGLIGNQMSGGLVQNVAVLGQVNADGGGQPQGSGIQIGSGGGIVGSEAGYVVNSASSVAVTASGEAAVGGLVGVENSGSAIYGSYATGAVGGGANTYDGGLVGLVNSGGSISNSYASAPVIGSAADVGGLVGDNSGTISNAFASGAVANVSGAAGGLVGRSAGGAVTNGYWDIQTTGQSSSGGGTGLTTAQLQGTAPISGSSFFSLATNLADPSGATWGGGAGGLYPFLKAFYPLGVQAISGIAYADAGVTPLATGVNGVGFVQFRTANGALFNPAPTGANGYYYALSSAGALPAGTSFAAYSEAVSPGQITPPQNGSATAVTYQQSTGSAALSGVNLSGGWQTDMAGAAAGSLSALNASDAALWSGSTAPSLPNRQIDFGSSTFVLDANVSLPGTLALDGSGSVTQPAGGTVLTANALALEGGGDFALTGAGNNITMLASLANSIDFTNASAFTVGTVTDATNLQTAGMSSPTGSGSMTLASGGDLTLAAPVTLPSGGVSLTALGNITQSNIGVIDATDLKVSSLVGDISLDAANSFKTLSGQASGSVSVFAQGDFTVNGMSAGLAGAVTLVSTAGGVTLASPVTAPSGTVVIAAATTFTNNVGPRAISTGNWQVYSAAPTGDTFNNLNSGNTAIWNMTYPGPALTSNRYIFALQPPLTVSVPSVTKPYGTDDTASLQNSYVVAGVQPGVVGAYLADTPATAYSGVPSITSQGSPATAGVAGSPYPIQIQQGTLVAKDGYRFVFTPGGELTVTPLPLTYSISAGSGVYGTQPSPGVATLNGVLPGDSVTPQVGASLNGAPVVLDASTSPGVYDQLVTALSNLNYSISATGNSAAPLVIVAPGVSPPPSPFLSLSPLPSQSVLGATSPALVAQFPLAPASLSGGLEQADGALSGLIVNCDVAPQFPPLYRGASPEQNLRRISQSITAFFRRCENANPVALADELDKYAEQLQRLAPQLPASFRAIPGIVAAAARRVRVAKTHAQVAAALRQAVVAIHKELTFVQSEDPAQSVQAARDNEIVAGALSAMSVAVVNSGSL